MMYVYITYFSYTILNFKFCSGLIWHHFQEDNQYKTPVPFYNLVGNSMDNGHKIIGFLLFRRTEICKNLCELREIQFQTRELAGFKSVVKD